ncbi:hypothetical protein M6D81_28020, partial [Paenibacillus sp. J5C_2022]|uniref:hypothetical protein n=1 Tax=Paenibacillus sp. J5C2022 TaxID=2977129 RepID=UPI0021CF266F
ERQSLYAAFQNEVSLTDIEGGSRLDTIQKPRGGGSLILISILVSLSGYLNGFPTLHIIDLYIFSLISNN